MATESEIIAAASALIGTIPGASELAASARDAELAALLQPHMPWVVSDTPVFYAERGILNLFLPDPTAGQACLEKLEAYAAIDTLPSRMVRRMLRWLQPPGDGIDLANAGVRGMLDSLAAADVITTTERDILKLAGEVRMPLTARLAGEAR